MFRIQGSFIRKRCIKPVFRVVTMITLIELLCSPILVSQEVQAQEGNEAQYEIVVELPRLPVAVTVDQLVSSPVTALSAETARFVGEDIQYLHLSGEPRLPYRIIRVLLPPDTILSTVSIITQNIQFEEIPGEWDVEPTPPLETWDGKQVTTVWPSGKTIIDGRDIEVYQMDAFYPESLLQAVNTGQMRKWILVEVPIALYQYNPVTKKLLATSGGNIVVQFNRDPSLLTKPEADALLADQISENIVEDLVINFDQVAPEYEQQLTAMSKASQASGYAILTTNQIRTGSSQLEAFTRSKERRGFKVYLVTEETWGGGRGDHAAENIRNWLKANYASLGIEYVLLIGNPHPTAGDVPMKMLWPKASDMYLESPSDYYYADLTGNWDFDGDGLFGEPEDFGNGGIDRNWEVVVGRIPFYDNIPDLDRILGKITAYENEPLRLTGWRTNVLLPMMRLSETTPGYDLGEEIKRDVIEEKGWDYQRVYEQNFDLIPAPETICDTIPYLCANNETKVTNVWNSSQFGAVFWLTHGSQRQAVMVMDTFHAATLKDSYPSFTFQGSCNNSWPEDTQNLSYTLLKNGAITSVGATRVSWYWGQEFDYNNSSSIPGMTYEFAERLITNEMDSGHALYDMKQLLYPVIWMNFTVFNLYGDPSIGLSTMLSSLDATVKIVPDTFNLGSKAKWVTAYVELPPGFDVSTIDSSTVMLESTIPTEVHPVTIGDDDKDGIADLMVKFSQPDLVKYLNGMTGKVTLLVNGMLSDGTAFEAKDTITVINPGKK